MTVFGRVVVEPSSPPAASRIEIRNGRIAALIPESPQAPDKLPFVFPGFIDAHTHPFETGLELLLPNLRGAGCIADVLDLLHQGYQTGHDCGVLVGLNLEPERLVECRFPTTEELDRVGGRIPTIVYRVDGHSAVLNSAGIELLLQEQGAAGMSPDGVVRGDMFEAASRLCKLRLLHSVLEDALQRASDLALQQGVTTVGALVGWPELKETEWRRFVDSLAALTVRAVPYLQTWNPKIARGFGLKQVGGCLLIDGSFGSHTAALSQPYDDISTLGVCYRTNHEITSFLRSSASLGLQTSVHAIGDRAVEQVIRCHQQAQTTDSGANHRIEHAELVPDHLLESIRRLEITLCVQPAFETTWGGPTGLYAYRLGQRWSQTNRLRELQQYGISLCGGSDSPITPLDPIAGIQAACCLPNPAQRLDPSSAMSLFTTRAAASLRIEGAAGTITPGASADLAILDADPRSSDSAHVIATVRAGRVVYRARPNRPLHPCQDSSGFSLGLDAQ